MTTPALPVWASDNSNNTPPITAQQKSGWTTNQKGVSSYDNWWKNLVYQWLGHLNHRDFLDQLIPAVASSTSNPEQYGNEAQTDFLYALTPSPGSAFLRQAAAFNKVQIAPGVLMQLRGGEIYAYRFNGTTEYTIANGDATNPRVDILQMKIDVVAGDTASSATVSVKQGTPAASPTYPAPDAGYCVIAGVVVGATYNGAAAFKFDDTAGAVAVLHDQRMPMAVHPVTVMPKDFACDPAQWVLVGTTTQYGATVQASGFGRQVAIPVKYDGTARLLGHRVGIYDVGTYSTMYRWRQLRSAGFGGGVSVADADLNNGHTAFANAQIFSVSEVNLVNVQSQHAPAVGPTVQANANGMGAPLWTSGRRVPSFGGSSTADRLMLQLLGDGGSQLGPATFYVAGGL